MWNILKFLLSGECWDHIGHWMGTIALFGRFSGHIADIHHGIGMLNQMLRNVNDSAISNRIRCKIAQLYLASGKPEYRNSAINVYQSIIDFAKENAEMNSDWTTTPEARNNQEWVDTSFVEAAKLYKAAGDSQKLKDTKILYHKLFPRGAKLSVIDGIN